MKQGAFSNKTIPMSIQQEILIFRSGWSSGYPCLEGAACQAGWIQSLEQICRSGQLSIMFPELAAHACGWALFLWQVLPGDHFLWIRQGTCADDIPWNTSIDPYQFLLSMNPN